MSTHHRQKLAMSTPKSKNLRKADSLFQCRERSECYPDYNARCRHISSMNDIASISSLSNIDDVEQQHKDFNDVVQLPYRDEERVVNFIRRRFLKKAFCTWTGQVLLAVHPYEPTQVNSKELFLDQPSISALVQRAWFHLNHELGKSKQAIVISGESGSGKTHAACVAIKQIADASHGKCSGESQTVLWKAWSSVPLLTAFGNAQTIHNNNSSRFGKLLTLQYADGGIRGAVIRTYLLEKSRVVMPNKGESNFHIFRQILDSVDVETLNLLQLRRDVTYAIAPRCSQKTAYAETVKALVMVGIHELDKILIVIAVVLNLGNVAFELNGDGYVISKETVQYVENVSKLLHVSVDELSQLLCQVLFTAKNKLRRNTQYRSPCINRQECEERRNCMMKFLYERLFLWLVDSMNEKIYVPKYENYLGLLDVYGYEVFDHNTFEQLCINYANERIQYYFARNYLMVKREELLLEGFDIEDMTDIGYESRVSLIDGPVSIFSILNEECMVKRFNSDCFVNTRIVDALRGRSHFIAPNSNMQTTFSIRHYAGVVTYDSKSMLCKNRDRVPDDIVEFLMNCNFDFLRSIIPHSAVNTPRTLVSNFKKSLDSLMHTLDECDVHYVKCLKPNPYKMAEFFDEDYFRQQLLTNGIFEILKLNIQRFNIKLNFEHFITRFSSNLFNQLQKFLAGEFHIGRRDIYLSEMAYNVFDRMRWIRHSRMARRIQLCWLRWYCHRTKAAIIIQRFYRRILRKRQSSLFFEQFADVSKKSDEVHIKRNGRITGNSMSSNSQIMAYLNEHSFELHSEGDQLSIFLEKVCYNTHTIPFKRFLFCGDRIASYFRLAEIPVRFHLNKTCLRFSYMLPRSERPTGLSDIL